jgi:hypothetical protein
MSERIEYDRGREIGVEVWVGREDNRTGRVRE